MKNSIGKNLITWTGLWVMLIASVAANAQPPALIGQQILDQVKANYAQCQSYMDSGSVTTIFITERGKRTMLKPFTTAFVRSDKFRFEFQERRGEMEWDRYIVFQEGAAIKSLWTMNRQEREYADLGQALGAAVGVSNSSSVLVPSLLLPDVVRGGMWKALTSVTLAGEEEVEKVLAYKLEAQDARGSFTFWVDKTRFVLLKLYRKQRLDPATIPGSRSGAPFDTETTTTFSPSINEIVPAARLAFLTVAVK